MHPRTCFHLLSSLVETPHPPSQWTQERKCQVLSNAHLHQQSAATTISGHIGNTALNRRTGVIGIQFLSTNFHSTSGSVLRSKQHRPELLSTGSKDPADTDDFTGPQREREVAKFYSADRGYRQHRLTTLVRFALLGLRNLASGDKSHDHVVIEIACV